MMFGFEKHPGAAHTFMGRLLLCTAVVSMSIPVEAAIYCLTFHATHRPTGAVACGVHCSDGSTHIMGCGADIFANGFDRVWVQELLPSGGGGGIGIGDIDAVLDTMKDLGYALSDNEVEAIETEVLSRVGLPEASCASEELTVPMLRRLGISFDEAAVEAISPAQ